METAWRQARRDRWRGFYRHKTVARRIGRGREERTGRGLPAYQDQDQAWQRLRAGEATSPGFPQNQIKSGRQFRVSVGRLAAAKAIGRVLFNDDRTAARLGGHLQPRRTPEKTSNP